MVKVLENRLVDLDLLPGQQQIDLQRQFREQMQNAKGAVAGPGGASAGGEVELPEGAQVLEGEEGAKAAKAQGFQIPPEALPENLSDEQKKQAKGFGGVIVDGSGKVLSGLTGTVGGVLKGVGDTAGNTVYGLGKTGEGLISGLASTATAPFAGSSAKPSDAQQSSGSASDEAAPASEEAVKKGPRKIELRGGGGSGGGSGGEGSSGEADLNAAAEPDAAGASVKD